MSTDQEASDGHTPPGESQHTVPHPDIPFHIPENTPTGMELKPLSNVSCDSHIPFIPVLQRERDLLDLANKLGPPFFHSPPAAADDPASGEQDPGDQFIFSIPPGGVYPKNRDERDVEVVSDDPKATYNIPFAIQNRDGERDVTGRNGMLPTPLALGPAQPAVSSPAEEWNRAVEEISGAWNSHAAHRRNQGLEPLWLDETLDQELQEEVGRAIRAADLPRALSAINHWRRTWLKLLGTDPEDKGWVEIDSTVLGEHVVVALRPEAVKDAKAARPDLVVYAPIEVERLHGTQDADLIREVHHAKKILGGVVKEPTLADDILAEFHSRVRHKNQSVIDMFSEARARLGYRDVEERCLTTWLRKHAPHVAALWPDAPPTSSWLDWRRKTGPEHMPALDRAFEAVTGCSVRSGGRGSP